MPDIPTMTVAAIGERALIDRIRARAGAPPSWIVTGIGDDAAVLQPERGALDVVTTDSLIEDVHFRRAWSSADAIGAKAVAVNFSDLAAMGARPRAVLLSLALPPTLSLDDFDRLIDGVVTAAVSESACLIGGNLSRSPGPLVVDVTAMGSVRRRRVLTRSGGRAGDELYVTGSVGGAAVGLAILAAGLDRNGLDEGLRECVNRYERPVARVRPGRVVAAHRAATAAIDLSDGLAAAVTQLAAASRAGATLEAPSIPVTPAVRAWHERTAVDPVLAALAGGEDYELMFAVSPRRRRAFLAATARAGRVTCTRIGVLTRGPGVWLEREGRRERLPEGFAHYSK